MEKTKGRLPMGDRSRWFGSIADLVHTATRPMLTLSDDPPNRGQAGQR